MKKISLTVLLALASITFLASCGKDKDVANRAEPPLPPPPPAPLVWDQGNWDEVVWQ